MLNYLYTLLESEARLAAAAAGLDPGIGFLHVDTDARDSLACDLMESCRAHVDAFLLEWIMSQPLRREWFFEQRDGSCRLMAPLQSGFPEVHQLGVNFLRQLLIGSPACFGQRFDTMADARQPRRI